MQHLVSLSGSYQSVRESGPSWPVCRSAPSCCQTSAPARWGHCGGRGELTGQALPGSVHATHDGGSVVARGAPLLPPGKSHPHFFTFGSPDRPSFTASTQEVSPLGPAPNPHQLLWSAGLLEKLARLELLSHQSFAGCCPWWEELHREWEGTE